MQTISVRILGLVFAFTLVLGTGMRSAAFQGPAAPKGADDQADKAAAQSPVEVYEWSIWVGNPAQTTINSARLYRNGMPSVVGTSRPKADEKESAGKFPIAPISVVQIFGEPCKDIDVDVRAKKGMILSHWPASKEHTGRLQWFGSNLTATPPAEIPQSYLPESHWLTKLRENKSALYLQYQTHYERFLAYDAELAVPIPLKIRGGPDEYTIQNLTNRRLLDVAVIAPAEQGYRVGWLDELPSANSEEKEKEKEAEEKKKVEEARKIPDPKKKAAEQEKKADELFKDAEAKPKEKAEKKEEAIPPLPAEGDATVRARVDQLLNQPITVTVQQAPRRELINLVTQQARLRYEVDDRTLAKEQIDLNGAASLKGAGIAARDALADLLGGAGLSYRVTEEGKLYITTAARLAEDVGKKGAAIEGPPVKLTMTPARKPSEPTYREQTRDALTRRLTGHGMRRDVVEAMLDQYGQSLFEPGELIVLAHFTREALDEALLLDVFPAPKKFVRSGLLVVHGVDPRLQDRARSLVKELGDRSHKVRESAEARLLELGPVSVPALEDALTNKDIEIVFRAERLLLRLHRSVP
ncbi:MAG: hypothetical protein ABS79_01945 [Planctomycetes bacterium SCN 63-9]|nr:MAG: hypothetical protein ABS79_01945 [Planctomycetes bacterium SCN 63-9]